MTEPHDRRRRAMVETQLEARGIADARVLEAMAAVPREAFVPEDLADLAYDDGPLDIGAGQTISQPYIVALMLEAGRIGPDDVVLDVGTGSGYAAAVAARLARRVVSIERIESLADAARDRLARLGIDTVEVVTGDGTDPPGDEAYDVILVAAAGPDVPASLTERLAPGGRLVMPVGSRFDQRLVRVVNRDGALERDMLGRVAFVPLIGRHGWSND